MAQSRLSWHRSFDGKRLHANLLWSLGKEKKKPKSPQLREFDA
jgi:hypothetical protein